jgi:hypothetical protein
MKIHILGAAGSGKTTLAELFSNRLDVPWFELDTIAYEGGYGRKRNLAQRLAALQELLAQPQWITEGVYLHWLDDLLDAADLIIWLDLPWYVAMPRIVTRHVKLSLAGRNRHPGVGKLLRFVWYCRTFYTDIAVHQPAALDDDTGFNRATTAHYLLPWEEKTICCESPRAVKALAARIVG